MKSANKLPTITLALALVLGDLSLAGAGEAKDPNSFELSDGWSLVSAANMTDGGDMVSKTGYDISHWYPVTVPSTVMAGLVANGVYSNLFMGTNMKTVPDLTSQQWWYRGQFVAPISYGGQYWLRFKGIAYKAEIWLNGKLLDANAEGTMVVHEYNVTGMIKSDGTNVVAVKVTPPADDGKNLSVWYVDWNPAPPDNNAGIWGKVFLDVTGPVKLESPFVKTVLPLPKTNSADLTVYVDAENGTTNPVSGVLTATISKPGCPTIQVEQPVTLAANERKEISFTPENFKPLHVENPVLWWPYQMGKPELYDMVVTFRVGGEREGAFESIKFGIRQITQYRTPAMNGKSYFQGFEVNGKNFLVRGGAYCWDLFMRWNTPVNEAHMKYAKDMGLNAIRFEGILGNEEIYDIADREGIMLIPGFVCCSRWEQWSRWTTNDFNVACASLQSQMLNMRAHPSALVWLFGSDNTPLDTPAHPVLSAYKSIAEKLHWQNATVNSAGQDGIKMDGPYVWEPPDYWYVDTKNGGAFGFCAEEGGETPPPIESLKKFIPPDELWPMTFGANSSYTYHSGKGEFSSIKTYNAGLDGRYGASSNLDEYSEKSQLQNYEAARGQFESMAARAYNPETKTGAATGTVFWMMDNSWPTIHWNLYDYFLKPAGSYFGAKKANEPVHALWDYSNRKVQVFNSTLDSYKGMTVSATVYNIPNLVVEYTNHVTLDVPADLPADAFTIPEIDGLSPTYFVRLQLNNSAGELVGENVYWYSTQPDTLNFSKADWYITPVKTYANLTGLGELAPNNNLQVSATATTENGDGVVQIHLANADKTNVAFFVRAEVIAGKDGDELAPIAYSDNYVSLWPGEEKIVNAKFAAGEAGGKPVFVKIKGWNVPEISTAATK